MSNLSNERLIELSEGQSGFNLRTANHEESMSMARELLAYREEQGKPVAYIDNEELERLSYGDSGVVRTPNFGSGYQSATNPLYAAPQLPVVPNHSEQALDMVNSPVIPDGWISISDRLPESKPGSYEYIVFETLNNRAHHDYWNVPYRDDDTFTPFWNHYGGYVTHWMQLPAAPKPEVK